ncbi:MAG: PD-(D/E)XK nuclease family protein [Candidatus Omnitrophota bacterium]|nr:PD-(D/E)XK nuclease family protein [Candidatus Omnitrophota bacterium]
MERVRTYSFGENFIDNIAELLVKEFGKSGNDFSRVACVFGGRRPSLFLRKALACKLKSPYLPPFSFSMDEFIEYILGNGSVKKINDLDYAYFIYDCVKKIDPLMLKGRNSFSQFLSWAREIASFIDQLDLEDIKDQDLVSIEKNAGIGYDVPQSINVLLQHIVSIRRLLHQMLDKNNMYTRGSMYLGAARGIGNISLDDFDAIIFCDCFYLHTTQTLILKTIYDSGKGIYVFGASQDDWSLLRDNAKGLKVSIRPDKDKSLNYELSLYQGFDKHSQCALVRDVLKSKKIELSEKTVIVLPNSDILIPLISEIAPILEDFNISMGYPLKGSALYALFDYLYKAHHSKKGDRFYMRDYLNLLRHPLVKNLEISDNSIVSRVMVHKIEEILQGSEKSNIGGSSFLSLDEIEAEDNIFRNTSATLQNMGIDASVKDCRIVLEKIHFLLFKEWGDVSNFSEFSAKLQQLVDVLVNQSAVCRFSFNLKVIEKLKCIEEEFKTLQFSFESFSSSEMWEIFLQRLQHQNISFLGSPLGGVQVLGLFETRTLNFDNVIVVDVNESALPKLKVYEPLIPRQVMLSLGINRLEKEEEIQHYHFKRLISAAKQVHLIYDGSQDKEKSRFIEELLWRKQKEQKRLDVMTVSKASFSINTFSKPSTAVKTIEVIEFLKRQTYSASRLNTYLRCPLQFYYQYVLGLKEKDDLLDDPQSSHLGDFIHKLLEETFSRFKGGRPVIDKEFRRYFLNRTEILFEKLIGRRMKSDAFLLKKIVINRLDKFLDNEAARDVDRIIGLEERLFDAIIFNDENIKFTYTVDRVDQLKNGSICVIDYKTGGANLIPKGIDKLRLMEETRESIKENIKSFQLPLYYYFTAKHYPGVNVDARLYSIRSLELNPFICKGDLSYKEEIIEICMKSMAVIFAELFNPEVNFEPDKEERKCQYCPFGLFCN